VPVQDGADCTQSFFRPEKKISPPKKSAQLDFFSSYTSDFLSHMMEFLKEKSSSESAFQDATRGCVPLSKRRHRG
jgi:hypothetical protein